MTLGQHLITIAEAGDAFSTGETNLSILLDIENILDKGRVYATADERTIINQKMDQLREIIHKELNSISNEDAKEFMIQRGRQAQNQFIL